MSLGYRKKLAKIAGIWADLDGCEGGDFLHALANVYDRYYGSSFRSR
jgi:muramidase (phage lysozyme)